MKVFVCNGVENKIIVKYMDLDGIKKVESSLQIPD